MISVLNKLTWLLASGCYWPPGAPDDAGREPDDKLAVVAAFFPIAEAVGLIGAGEARVTDLTPAGTEPHDLELASSALDSVLDADIVFYLKGFQPALDDVVGDTAGEVVDLLEGLPTEGSDPHIWLDPQLWRRAVLKVQDVLIRSDPARSRIYRRGGDAYAEILQTMDRAFAKGLSSCERDLVVTAHGAFGYLTDRYGLRQESIAGVSPEAEPDPKHLAELADLVRDEGVTTVFTEELVSPEVAQALAREAGVRTDVLDPIESESSVGYVAAMTKNFGRLRKALACK